MVGYTMMLMMMTQIVMRWRWFSGKVDELVKISRESPRTCHSSFHLSTGDVSLFIFRVSALDSRDEWRKDELPRTGRTNTNVYWMILGAEVGSFVGYIADRIVRVEFASRRIAASRILLD